MCAATAVFYCNKIYSGKNLFLPAKTIFASPVFSMEKPGFSTFWQKPANPILEIC